MLLHRISALSAVLFLLAYQARPLHAEPTVPEVELQAHAPPAQLYPVLRVADGDTITVDKNGRKEKIRLLNVDTEEAGELGRSTKPSKPNTTFGQDCRQWAVEFFTGPRSEVGLWHATDREARGTFGRLLAHVVLPDGNDFNLLLVRSGKSPYFNKYGNSLVFDADFRRAQALARKEQIGIWNPETNRDGPKRPYDQLLPWWEARADAVDIFRTRAKKEPHRYFDASDPEALALAAADSAINGILVTVFGLPQAIYVEDDESRTVVFHGSFQSPALRVRIAAADYPAHKAGGIPTLLEEYHQNYVWVTGVVRATERGFSLESTDPSQWKTEPAYPVR
jgi:micrococcal nuclease